MKKLHYVLFPQFLLFLFFFNFGIAHADVCAIDTRTTDNTRYFGYTPAVYRAVPFTLSSDCTPDAIGTKLAGVAGSPTDQPIFYIYSDSGGSPGIAVETSDPVGVETGWATSTISSPAPLTAGNYWVVLGRTGTVENTDVFEVAVDDTTLGGARYTSGAWTTDDGYLFPFEVDSAYAPPPTPTSTPPVGYIPSEQEELFIFGILLFLLSIPFWERTLSVTKGYYDFNN